MESAISSPQHAALVQRITAARVGLESSVDADTRNTLLDELGAANRELTGLILEKEGRLKSPLE